MAQTNNIILTGFMGTGKTTVARELARMTGMHAVELDAEIEQAVGMSIPEIFERHGEQSFRDIETEAVRKLAGRKGLVVSTGGGAVIREENRRLLKEAGIVVCLSASAQGVYERIRYSGNRPLLEVPDPQARIVELLQERAAWYAEADITVETDGRSPMDIAQEILERVRHEAH